jgi:mannose-6-phosphate isomerase-like protein (cupin superfamily)
MTLLLCCANTQLPLARAESPSNVTRRAQQCLGRAMPVSGPRHCSPRLLRCHVAPCAMTCGRTAQLDSSGSRPASIAAAWQVDTRGDHTPHTHRYAALAFVLEGESVVDQHGRWHLRAGDLMLVPAGKPHGFLERRNPEYLGLAFCVPCFVALGGPALVAPFERLGDGACAVVQIPGSRHAFVEQSFRELVAGAQRSSQAGATASP